MGFGILTVTNAGLALQAKVLAGAALAFTKAQAGSGALSTGQTPSTMVALAAPKQDIVISSVTPSLPNKLTLRIAFTNSELVVGYYWREIGVFATDPDVGEILYAYCNAADEGSFMPAALDGLIEQIVDLVTLISNVATVTVSIDNAGSSPLWADLIVNGVIPCAGTGTNTVTVNNPNILEYADGMKIALDMALTPNTGAATININGKGAKAAVTQLANGSTTPLIGGETAGITVWQYKAAISSFVLLGALNDERIGNRTLIDTEAPTGNTGFLVKLFSWIAYMIKAITGEGTWRTAPATTLKAAKTHADATTGMHGAVSAATADKLMIRDANGRAKVAAPSDADDIARKDTVDPKLDKTGGTMTGILTAQSNTSYTVAQVHNVILSTGDAVVGSMNNGDIWIKYV